MSKRLDVLFVHTGSRKVLKEQYQGLVRDHATEQPVLGRYMLQNLINHGFEVGLLDGNVADLPPDKMAEEVQYLNPALVIVKASSFNPSSEPGAFPSAHQFIKAIKNLCPQIPMLMVGSIPAGSPNYVMENTPVDFVCSGDGVNTVVALMEALRSGSDASSLRKVHSLYFRENGHIFKTFPGPVFDINAFPVRDAWKLNHMSPLVHKPHNWHIDYDDYANHPSYAVLLTSTNCPFACAFCMSLVEFRENESGKLRMGFLKPEAFAEEVAFLFETFGTVDFKIKDEMFGIGNHPMRCAQALIQRLGNDAQKLNIWAYFRADTLRPEHLDTLRHAGFKWAGIGVEAADSIVRSGQDKDFTDEKIHDVVQRAKDSGIEAGLNYIFGLPGEDMECMIKTFRMSCELNSPFANYYVAKALPGAQLYEDLKQTGFSLPQTIEEWSQYGQYTIDSIPHYQGNHLSTAQIQAMRDWAQHAYFGRPEYQERMKKHNRFGAKALLNIEAWRKDMLSVKRNLFGGESFLSLAREEQEKLLPLSSLENI